MFRVCNSGSAVSLSLAVGWVALGIAPLPPSDGVTSTLSSPLSSAASEGSVTVEAVRSDGAAVLEWDLSALNK